MWHSNWWRFLSSGILVMIVFFGSVGFTMYHAHGAGESIFQLTDNQYNDGMPQIHNGQVTWYGYDGNDDEIFLFDGSSVIQLTDNEYEDTNPQIHNGQVTWRGYGYDIEGRDQEIFLFDGSSVIQLTDNEYEDRIPQIHNGQVTWTGYDGSDREIFLYDGSSVIQLTDNEYEDTNPQIHNGQVTWTRSHLVDGEIFLYAGSWVIQLTDNQYNDRMPQIHNGQVTWHGYDGNDDEIYLSKRGRAVIHYEPENTLIKSDGSNTIDILVVTPENSILLAPGESYILPDAMRLSSIPGVISEPPASSSLEPETEPEQRGIPGFPYLAIALGLGFAILFRERFRI